ncbi:hypothetical protein BHM03_00028663 [Ensete ventricosum]|nr:hypothetical protein BHM03_00028663 [Ensete ventricosum]
MVSFVETKVCNFDLYRPVWAVHTGPPGYRYADRPLPGGSVKNRPSAVDFGRRRPIEEEIDRRRSIEEEKGKKKRKRKKEKEEGKKEYLARAPSLPACCRRPRVACALSGTGPISVPTIYWYTGTDRWGQVFILDALSRYKASDAREAENIVERVTPRLQHANCAVVLSAVKVFFCKYNDPIYVKMEKLEIMIKLASDRNIDQVQSSSYGDFPVCSSLLSQDALLLQASMIWIIGEYAERIDNADELLESFLETFPEEPALVQLQLLTATVKLFLKKPTEGPQQMIQAVLNNATMETDNPDLRDRAYIYWRLLSTDPEVSETYLRYSAAKDVVLAEKPVISDDSNQLDPSLLDELLANIATLSSVYHKIPDAFVSRAKSATPRPDDDDYADGGETGYSESPSHAVDGAAAPSSAAAVSPAQSRQQPPATTAISAPVPPVPDLLGDLIGLDNAIVPYLGYLDVLILGKCFDCLCRPPLPVLLPSSTGQGLQISSQLIRHDGQIFYSMLFENNTQLVLDGFMIQFNKNTFGLAAAGPLQVIVLPLQPEASARTLLPMVLFQNVAPGPPSTILQVAVKNNQQPVWYFNDKISLHVFFGEDGRMERANFLEVMQTWKSLPDSNEAGKDLSNSIIHSVDATIEHLTASNVFFVAKRRNADKELLYLSAKIPRGIPFLIELMAVLGVPGVKCAVKTQSPEMAPLLFEAMETLLK